MPMPLDAPVINAVFLLVFIREEYVVQESENASNSNQCGRSIAVCDGGVRADEADHARNAFSDEASRSAASESRRQIGRLLGDGARVRREGSRFRSVARAVGRKREAAPRHILEGRRERRDGGA